MPDSLLESFPYAAAVVDSEGRTLEANGLWRADFGSLLKLEDPLAQRLYEQTLADVLGTVSRPVPIVHSVGGRWFQTRLAPVLGRPGVALVSHEDVTAFKASQQSEERLKLALLASDDGLFDWDVKSGAVRGNLRLTRMLGYGPDELATIEAWNALCHPEDLDRVNGAMLTHLKGQTPEYRTELRVRTRDGSYRWVLDRGRVVERDAAGRALRMMGLHTDIEDRKRLEAQVQISGRMASVGALAATLAHELSTPLSYLATGLSALTTAKNDAHRDEALKIAHDGAARIREVVRDVKTFSHVDPAQTRREVDVSQSVEQAVRLARHLIERRGSLEVTLGPMPKVFAHDAQLSHVFLNLLVNAAQALPNDGVRHRVRVVGCTDARGWAVIEVEDSGRGISPEVARRVFEPFFTTRPAGEGTGLGLALCRSVVDGAGGAVGFTSEPGRTSFKVELPPAPKAEGRTGGEADPGVAQRRRVLVIDDHLSMGTSLKIMLRDDHEIDAVTSADAAFELLAGGGYDVILCDLMMPGVSGVDLYQRVVQQLPHLAERFIFMTGGTTSAAMSQFLAGTRRKVLEKPFAAEALRALLISR